MVCLFSVATRSFNNAVSDCTHVRTSRGRECTRSIKACFKGLFSIRCVHLMRSLVPYKGLDIAERPTTRSCVYKWFHTCAALLCIDKQLRIKLLLSASEVAWIKKKARCSTLFFSRSIRGAALNLRCLYRKLQDIRIDIEDKNPIVHLVYLPS